MKVKIENKFYMTLDTSEQMKEYLTKCRELKKLAIPKVYKTSQGVKLSVYEILDNTEETSITFDDIKANLTISSLSGETKVVGKIPTFMLQIPSNIYQYCDSCKCETNHVHLKKESKVACKQCGTFEKIGLYRKAEKLN